MARKTAHRSRGRRLRHHLGRRAQGLRRQLKDFLWGGLLGLGSGVALVLLVALAVAGCRSAQTIPGAQPERQRPTGWSQRGTASWYGPNFHGNRTANGEVYDMHGLTAAHRTLPFDTWIRVTNLDNGRSVDLRINDRGPFVKGRILDVSYGAAQALGMVGPGLARVRLEVVGGPLPAGAVTARARPRAAQRFTVQAGAFQEEAKARLLAAELRRRFPGARVRSRDGWHRVQVGSFESREAAQELWGTLAAGGYEVLVVAVP